MVESSVLETGRFFHALSMALKLPDKIFRHTSGFNKVFASGGHRI